MKFGVVIFPGSNCDHDMIYVLDKILKQRVVELWHKSDDLQGADFIILPGGFSYGDYLRSGAIARFSPIMEKIISFANNGGYVLGICNGFQILCESGLLPGALLHNESQKFVCKNVYIMPAQQHHFITKNLNKSILKIPVAHGEGRYYADQKTFNELKERNQILFRYCDVNGNPSDETNPNGSIDNIAGIANTSGNVIGMMPHPERASDAELGNTDGLLIFESMMSIVS